jgi:hypothetical protein
MGLSPPVARAPTYIGRHSDSWEGSGMEKGQISTEGKLGLLLGLIGIAGAGAMNRWPEQPWIGTALLAISAIGFVALGFYNFRTRLASLWGARRTVIALAMVTAVLWFDYWYYSNMPANGWYWHLTVSFPVAAITPPSQPPPPPPVKPPEKPWVTDDEVEQARKKDRVLVRYSPADLARMVMYNQRDIAVYRASWIKFSETFQSVDFVEMTDKTKVYGVKGTVSYDPTLLFEPKKWGPTLLTLKEGQHIEGVCQIVGVVERVFYLTNCELN